MSEISSGDLQILRGNRTGGGRKILAPRGYFVSVEEQEEVFAGQLAIDPVLDLQTLGIHAIAVDNTTGSHTDTARHMTIDFGTTPGGTDLGQARLRGATSSVLTVSEMSPAALPIAKNDYFSVKRTWRPWLVLPRGVAVANGTPYTNQITMYVDYDIPYNDQNENFTPKANITRSATVPFAPKPAGFVDGFRTSSPQTYRTMVLSSAFSFCFGDTIANLQWDVQDGTITVGSDTDATITVRFPVGFRWISLNVVSDSGGKTGTMYFPIWVHDETYMPLTRAHKVRDFTGDWREVELEFFQQETSETVIPKGTAICCWEYDPFWGEDIPDQYRDQFLGWSKEDVTLFRKYDSRNTLIVSGLAEWMSRYRAIPMRVYDPLEQAGSWFEMENITNDKLAFYLLENFSTANFIGNLHLSGNTDRLKSLDLTGNSLFGQVQYAVLGYQGIARCDSLNSIWLRKHYPYMTLAERAAVDITMALTQADRTHASPLRLMRRNWFAVASVLGAGGSFDGTTQTIYNSRAPGRTPLDSNSEQDAPGINLPTTDSQTVLNWLTGQHLAVLNNANDSVLYSVLPNLDCVEPAWDEPIRISDVNPDSGYTVSNKEFLVKEVNVTYEKGYEGRGKRVEYTLQEVTTGIAGQTVEVIEDSTEPADYEPPGDIYIPIVPPLLDYPPGLSPGIGSLVLWGSDGHAWITDDFTAVSPTYSDVTLTVSGNHYDAVVDPWTYIDGTPDTSGWYLTHQKVYKADITPARTVNLTEQFAFNWDANDIVNAIGIHTNIAARNFVAVLADINNNVNTSRRGQWLFTSTDGTNWSGGQLSNNLTTRNVLQPARTGLFVSAHAAGRIFIIDIVSETTLRLLRNDNYGVGAWTTLAAVTTAMLPGATVIHGGWLNIPYPQNADDGVIYFSCYHGNVFNNRLALFKYDHGTLTYLSAVIDPVAEAAGFNSNIGIDFYPENRNEVRLQRVRTAFSATGGGGGGGSYEASSNDGGSWTEQEAASPMLEHCIACIGSNNIISWGRRMKISLSIDGGATRTPKVGNLPQPISDNNQNITRIWGLK